MLVGFTDEQMGWLDEQSQRKWLSKSAMLRVLVEEAMKADKVVRP